MRMQSLFRFLFGCLIVALVPFVLWYQLRQDDHLCIRGLVESESENVGPIETARIVSIEVKPGQQVKPGDILVRFDPADRTTEKVMNAARLKDYEQSAARNEQDQRAYRQTLQDTERKYRQLVREASVALEEQKMNRIRDKAELDALRAEIQRLTPLVEKRLVSELDLSSLRPKADALEETVNQYAPLIDSLQKRLDQATADLKEVHDLAVTAERIAREAASKEPAKPAADSLSQEDPTVLRALSSGTISQIYRRVGDVVPAGEPVVRVTATTDALFITGILPMDRLNSVREGDTLRVFRVSETGGRRQAEEILARVEMIAPEVMDVFDPTSSAPRVPVRGRKIRLIPEAADHTLVPGESVMLSLLPHENCWQGVKRLCMFWKTETRGS
ncbi:MAG: HlyD family efflux transporter periplasmic adaptor subunit [Kiritimatiellae bacterium]|nr:HlyD family efflux transporter periplasmic adaptor subunit [Kiritimatiellia bacterium]